MAEETKQVPDTDTSQPADTHVGVSSQNAPSDEELAQQRADAVVGTDRQIKTVQDWMDAEENRPETPEERKKRERREKSKRIIGAVSDGLSALGNLYFTTQYAPNMYNHEKSSMTDAISKRLEQQKAEREKKRDQYFNYAMMLGKLEEGQEDKAYQRGRDALKDSIAEAKADRDAKLADIRYRAASQKLNEAEAKQAEWEANEEYRREVDNAKLEEIKSRTAKNNRTGSGTSGGGKTGQFTVWRINPQTGEKEYKSGFRSESSARNYAATHSGEGWAYSTTPSTSIMTKNDKRGKPQTSTIVRDTSTQINTMPGVGGNGSTKMPGVK